jgi:hypothetical protein
MGAKERVECVLGLCRFVWAWVCDVRRGRRCWRGPVWVQVPNYGPRAEYAVEQGTGVWYAPRRWKPAKEYAEGRVAA